MKIINKNVWIALFFWLLPIISFWFYFAYQHVPILYILIVVVWYPFWTCIVSYFIARGNRFGKWQWAFPLIFGLLNRSVYYLTFGISNALSISKVDIDDIGTLMARTIISASLGYIAMAITEPKGSQSKTK